MDISVVIPLLNEEESIPELAKWIEKVMKENSLSYEIVFIDDGSRDSSWQLICQMSEQNLDIKGIKFRRNYGKSAALNTGFAHAEGDVVITMDADLQDSPDEIPELYKMIIQEKYDLVSGWKKKRYDPLSKTLPTKLFNWATRRMTKINLHDFNCGLKAYSNQVVKSIEVYGEMHRYIPFIAKLAGFSKIGEKVVVHRARKYGTTKFGGISRFINGFLDLISISFISRFGKRPMHIFGLLGTFLFLIGFIIAGYFSYHKIFNDMEGMTDRPLFFLGLLSMVIGSQLFIGGFIAEMISRSSHDRNQYLIQQKVNLKKSDD